MLITWTLARAVFPRIAPDLAEGTYWSMAVAATIGLLFSIIFHEMAHSLVARRYGLPIRGITLFIFGGVAEMEGEPSDARSEFLMALAGPVASLVLAALMLTLAAASEVWNGADALHATLWYLGAINGVIALFNLVPAFPLDGGRMLRAALWSWRGDLASATRLAAGAGNYFGVLLIALGVLGVLTGDFVGGMWRFLIGMFLREAAATSYRETLARTLLKGVPISAVMTKEPIGVPPETSIAAFIEDFVYRHHHRSFPVVRQGALVGCVGTTQAAAMERSRWAAVPVAEIMLKCRPEDIVDPETDAHAALQQMRRGGQTRLWVVKEGRLVGVLSLSDMLELLSAKIELKGGAEPRPTR